MEDWEGRQIWLAWLAGFNCKSVVQKERLEKALSLAVLGGTKMSRLDKVIRLINAEQSNEQCCLTDDALDGHERAASKHWDKITMLEGLKAEVERVFGWPV